MSTWYNPQIVPGAHDARYKTKFRKPTPFPCPSWNPELRYPKIITNIQFSLEG
jgi:hypothetical protein